LMKETQMSRVDVIVPCYNYAHFLQECVGSVLAQQGVDVRVLIIDDASSDNTVEVAGELAKQDSRVEFRRHPVNHGHIATYNEGLDWGTGEYMLLLSADDMLTAGALARASRLMDAHPEVGFTYGQAITTDTPKFDSVPPSRECRWRILTGTEFWELSFAEAANIVPTPTAVVRTSLQQALGGYRKELPHTGDFEMWLRFAAHASVGVLDTAQGFYRVHGKNMHVKDFPITAIVLQQHLDAIEILFREYGKRIADRERMKTVALRAIALSALRKAIRSFEGGDQVSCQKLLDSALLILPQIRNEREWSNFRLKRLMGVKLWSVLRPLVRRLRRRSMHNASPFGDGAIIPVA
jgi:glycosyltransferase involved in cell wall biosynthesis